MVERLNIRNSQNFLRDINLVRRLVRMSSLTIEDVVFEIVGGKGIITSALASVCKKVISIEADPQIAETLKKKFVSTNNVEIVFSDFLRYVIPTGLRCKFFSNIPFNITAEIMTKVLAASNVEDIYFIMQYEAFLKYAGEPYYSECLKSLIYKPYFETELLHEFEPADFSPAPKARIVFARFRRKNSPDIAVCEIEGYKDFLCFVFEEKGKSLKEKLKRLFSYEQLKRASKNIGFSVEQSLSDLKFAQWLALYELYKKYVSPDKKALVTGANKKLSLAQGKLQKIHRNRHQNGGTPRNGKR